MLSFLICYRNEFSRNLFGTNHVGFTYLSAWQITLKFINWKPQQSICTALECWLGSAGWLSCSLRGLMVAEAGAIFKSSSLCVSCGWCWSFLWPQMDSCMESLHVLWASSQYLKLALLTWLLMGPKMSVSRKQGTSWIFLFSHILYWSPSHWGQLRLLGRAPECLLWI